MDVPLSTHATSKYIILKSQAFNFPDFLNEVHIDKVKETESVPASQRLLLEGHELTSIINIMDTEWDKTCAKVLVGANKSIAEMRALGIDPDTIPKSITLLNRLETV